jgi:hypothetical protein
MICSYLDNSTGKQPQAVGCNLNYKWCAYTPPVNVFVYFIPSVFMMGIAMPLLGVYLDSLFSKILGPIWQVDTVFYPE